MNIIPFGLLSVAFICVLMMFITFFYEELTGVNKTRLIAHTNDSINLDDFLLTKENASEFLINKREIDSVKESVISQTKNNYEVLLEQIYIERSLCVDPNNKLASDKSLSIDKKTCERYCQSYSCDQEPVKVCGDSSWANYKGSCYKITPKKLNWLQAKAKCQEFGANLVVINDELVQSFITNWLINTEDLDQQFFIGLLRTNKNSFFRLPEDEKQNWEWVTNETLQYSNWNNGEPNNDRNVENCVELILSGLKTEQGKWNDIPCDDVPRKSICERKAESVSSRDKDEIVYEFMRFRELNEENVVDFINLLNEVTSKDAATFTAEQIINVVNVLVKITNLSYFPQNGTKGFFGTINNLLYASDDIYKQLKNVSNTILKTIDIITTKIKMKQTTNVSQEVKVQVPNIAVSINDISLDTRSRNDEVSQIFKTSDDDDTARLLIRTNFTSFKNRITPSNEYNKTDYGYNINGNQTAPTPINGAYRLSIVYFKTRKLFQKMASFCSEENFELSNACSLYNSEIGGTIVSVNVNTMINSQVEKESDAVDYDIKYSRELMNSKPWCGYWVFVNESVKEGGGYWSDEGCEYISYNIETGSHKCRCNHTTHYALLFTSQPNSSTKPLTKVELTILSTVTYIGLSLSILGLVLTLITYAIFKAIRQGIIHKSLIILAICLLISNYLFIQITFVKPEINKTFCYVTAVLLHYMILVSFMWMLTIAVAQYLTFVKIINNHIDKFILKSSFLSFGLPIVMPLTIIAIDINSYYNKDQEVCWLSGAKLYSSFIAPIGVVLLTNLGFFISILFSIFNRSSKFQTNSTVRRNQVGASLCCFVLMGFTWLYGFTLIFNYEYRIVNEIIFAALNTTQGFFIFMFHVLLSKTKRNLWSKMINKDSSKSSNQKTNSNTKSNSTDNQTPLSNFKIDSFKQSININSNPENNGSSNQIYVTNTNNLILNTTNSINPTSENLNDELKLKQLNNLGHQTTAQHHHYHHHIHHHKNQPKRKKQRINNESNNIDRVGKTRSSRFIISDEYVAGNLKTETPTKFNGQVKRFSSAYSSF